LNCGTRLDEEYCPRCGQAATDVNVSFPRFTAQFLSEAFDLDSRVARTLGPLLLSPGRITLDYIAGRRVRYVHPLRLFLVVSLLYFFLLAIVTSQALLDAGPVVDDNEITEEDSREVEELLGGRVMAGAKRAAEDPRDFVGDLIESGPTVMFLVLPIFALLLKLLHPRRLLVQHLVFALHVHAVLFMIMTPWVLLGAFAPEPVADRAGWLLLYPILYTPLAMHTVYGGRWWATLLRFALLSLAHSVVLLTALVLAVVGTLALS
jgi:hypothetical protein